MSGVLQTLEENIKILELLNEGKAVEEKGPNPSRNKIQTITLLDAIEKHKFDAAFGGGRRDEDRAGGALEGSDQQARRGAGLHRRRGHRLRGRRHEGERRHNYLVAGTDAQAAQAELFAAVCAFGYVELYRAVDR